MSGSSPIEMVAGVVAAFVSNNSVPIGELPALIRNCSPYFGVMGAAN